MAIKVNEDKDFSKLREEFSVPAWCPACGCIMDNWSAKNYFKHYVCSDCHISYIEGRSIKKETLNDKKLIQQYVKNKIKEKNS